MTESTTFQDNAPEQEKTFLSSKKLLMHVSLGETIKLRPQPICPVLQKPNGRY